MKAFIAVLALMAGTSIALAVEEVPQFRQEKAAKLGCGTDTVVWLEAPKHIYHYPGRRWYGVNINGVASNGESMNDYYTCEAPAARHGAHPSKNGM